MNKMALAQIVADVRTMVQELHKDVEHVEEEVARLEHRRNVLKRAEGQLKIDLEKLEAKLARAIAKEEKDGLKS